MEQAAASLMKLSHALAPDTAKPEPVQHKASLPAEPAPEPKQADLAAIRAAKRGREAARLERAAARSRRR